MSPIPLRLKHPYGKYTITGWRKVIRDQKTHYLVNYYKGFTYLAACGLILSPESFLAQGDTEHCPMCERVLAWQQHTDSVAHGGK